MVFPFPLFPKTILGSARSSGEPISTCPVLIPILNRLASLKRLVRQYNVPSNNRTFSYVFSPSPSSASKNTKTVLFSFNTAFNILRREFGFEASIQLNTSSDNVVEESSELYQACSRSMIVVEASSATRCPEQTHNRRSNP